PDAPEPRASGGARNVAPPPDGRPWDDPSGSGGLAGSRGGNERMKDRAWRGVGTGPVEDVSEQVGMVLGTEDATPLTFWVAVAPGSYLQLDDAVIVDTEVPGRGPLRIAGLARDGEPMFLDLDFLDGSRGAHVNISGVSGVATKTTYALFLLYALFHSPVLGGYGANTKALVFNVKGEDLMWLDRPNARLDEAGRADYDRLGLPAGPFESVGLLAPVGQRAGGQAIPATSGR